MNAQQVAERSAVYALEDAVAPVTYDAFDLLATAPHGVAKLRELILSLAVQGKLVPQVISDRPASALLAKIGTERARLATGKRSRNHKSMPLVVDGDMPFALPRGWVWTCLGEIGDWGAGATPLRSRADYYGGDIPWFKSGELSSDFIEESEETITPLALKECSLRENQAGDVLVAMYGATIGKVSILARPATTNQAVCACTPHAGISNRYVSLLLKTLRNHFVSIGAGAAQPNISREKIVATVIALPPSSEQARIAARVEELLALCDELETRGRLQDEQHARLVATLFDALVASASPAELADNWQRVASHFDLLLDRPEAVDALEQTVLQLAIRGLLVPQDPADEPASELLGRIRAEKAELAKAGKIKQAKVQRPVTTSDSPFNVPASWVWTRFGELVHHSEAGWSPRCDDGQRQGGAWGVLKVSAVSWGEFRSHENKQLPSSLKPRVEYEVHEGDFLISRANTAELVARSVVAVQPEPRLMLSDKLIRLNLSALAERRYANLVNNAEFARAYYAENASGTSGSMKNVSREVILNLPMPLPPLAEQRRIVTRVEELRRLCANLRKHLQRAQATQSNLADALVARAVA